MTNTNLTYNDVWKLAEKLHAHQKYDSREYGVHLSDVSNVLLMEVNGFHTVPTFVSSVNRITSPGVSDAVENTLDTSLS